LWFPRTSISLYSRSVAATSGRRCRDATPRQPLSSPHFCYFLAVRGRTATPPILPFTLVYTTPVCKFILCQF
jgi:hypothetical protein